jgi:hypothetical protein
VRAFIVERFGSVAEIDVFLHAYRNGREWTADSMGRATGLRASHAQVVLDALVRSRLMDCVNGVYALVADVLDDASALSEIYDRYRLRIVPLVLNARRAGG